jgi:hypothetical protein
MARACRVAPSGRRSEKLNNGGEFPVFGRDSYRSIFPAAATSMIVGLIILQFVSARPGQPQA